MSRMKEILLMRSYRLHTSVIVFVDSDCAESGSSLIVDDVVITLRPNLVVFIRKGAVIDVKVDGFFPRIMRISDELVNRIVRYRAFQMSVVSDIDKGVFSNASFLLRDARSVDESLFIEKFHQNVMDASDLTFGFYELMVVIDGFGDEIYNTLYTVSKPRMIDKVRDIVMSDISKRWRLTEVCDVLHISEIALRKSLENDGISFTDLVYDLKMREAITLIINTDNKVDKVAVMLGYSNTSYFIKSFKEYFGVSPKKLDMSLKV